MRLARADLPIAERGKMLASASLYRDCGPQLVSFLLIHQLSGVAGFAW
jgi:hypothetical protein